MISTENFEELMEKSRIHGFNLFTVTLVVVH